MKSILVSIVAAVLVVGCGESQPPEPPKAKALKIPIHAAVSGGNIEAVKQHIAIGTDVNAKKSDDGWTPLHMAAMRGSKEIAELLIAADADVNAKDHDGDTPLDMAIIGNQNKIANFLRKHGAKESN
ncbi:ankyrin repeat domain-containing protein [bacterium]|nr:ankyrin repeat domain-containing protein [bacterium]